MEKEELLVPENNDDQSENSKSSKKGHISGKVKIILKLTGFIICSLIYLFSISQSRFHNLIGDISSGNSLQYTDTIMIFTYGMSILAILIIIYFLFHVIKPKRFKWKMEQKQERTASAVLDWLLILPICVTFATFCFAFIFTFTVVNGSSMEPNIYSGDQLLLLYQHQVERFDVVVIDVTPEHYNYTSNKFFLKRIIGLPGDSIDYVLEDGRTQLYINGEKVDEYFYQDITNFFDIEEYVNTFDHAGTQNVFNWEDVCKFKNEEGQMINPSRIEGKLLIPDGYYFVLGDHRSVSDDSRTIGLVREEDILGVATHERNSIFEYRRIP